MRARQVDKPPVGRRACDRTFGHAAHLSVVRGAADDAEAEPGLTRLTMVGESGTGNTPVMAMCSRSAWHCLHRLLGVEVFLASAYNVASDVRLEHRPWMEPPWLRRLCLEGKPSGEFLGRKRTATWTTRRYGKHGECRLRGRQTNGNDKATSKLQVGAAGAICVADLSGSEGPLGTRRERGHRQKKKKFRQQAAQSRRSKSPSWFQLSDGGSKWQVP
ncbi:hypothetical protein BN1708_006241 [Verticillium longisporum]|uniref:Uncharacterized protein n=1 Tax=Verticillium longisporum TaxID=100787 RepID=A0A0G4MIB1_VERLO|nr:hypothetical protein BN1708_006241 [Verticillium longisporum]